MSKQGGKIALVLGMVTGAATGLLFAPSRGKDLRKKIAAERKKGGSGTRAVGDDLKRMGEDIFGLMKEIAEMEEVQKAIDKTKGTAAEMVNMKKEDLDKLVKKAHTKAEDMKVLVTKFAKEKKTQLENEVKKKTKKAKTKAKKVVKKATTKGKEAVTKAKKVAKKVEKKVAPKKKTTPNKKPSTKKKAAPKKKTTAKKK
ncbi:MAG: YtxH domain-containing protein [Patescibacteria group bacterium]|nr:YtxH domain-containing protein [Patescibacteria group bacterium]